MAEPITIDDTRTAVPERLRIALIVYRALAYTVGVGLVVLTCVGVPMQIWAHNKSVVNVVGFTHGMLYMVYVIAVFVLAGFARWRIQRTVLIALAGTVPFLSFVAERFVTRWVREGR